MLFLFGLFPLVFSPIFAMEEPRVFVTLLQPETDGMRKSRGKVTYDLTSLPPLHEAVRKNDIALVEQLLDEESTDLPDHTGKMALHHAVICGNTKCVSLLCDRKASLENKDNEGRTPLCSALDNAGAEEAKQIEIAKLLLRAGADLENASDCKERFTALHTASAGKKELVKFLISEGANINAQSSLGETPLFFVAKTHFLFLEGKKNQSSGNTGAAVIHASGDTRAAVIHAIEHWNEKTWSEFDDNCKELIQVLIEEGTNLGITDNKGRTVDCFEAVRHILSKMNSLNNYGQRESNVNDLSKKLHLMAYEGNLKECQSLIEQKANVNACDSNGARPLHTAAAGGHTDVCDIFLLSGAPVNVKDRHGCSALHLAIEGAHNDTCSLLLKHEANINSTNNADITPLQCAAAAGETDICRLLLRKRKFFEHKSSKEGGTALHKACENGNLETAKLLISNGARIDAKKSSGWTPLHSASFHGDAAMCTYLLDNGSNIDEQNSTGNSPLHCSILGGHEQVVSLLCERQADLTIRNTHGDAPLHIAAKNGTKQNNEAICKLLLQYKASPFATNFSGYTPCQCGLITNPQENIAILKLFLKEGAHVAIKNTHGYCSLHNEGKEYDFHSLEEVSNPHQNLVEWMHKNTVDNSFEELNSMDSANIVIKIEALNKSHAPIYRIILEHSLCLPLLSNRPQRDWLRDRILMCFWCMRKSGLPKDITFEIMCRSYLKNGIVTLLIYHIVRHKLWRYENTLNKIPLKVKKMLIHRLVQTTYEYIGIKNIFTGLMDQPRPSNIAPKLFLKVLEVSIERRLGIEGDNTDIVWEFERQ